MVQLAVQITPNAPRNQVVGWLGDKLKIKVKAPAVEGKANAELLRFLSETLDIRPNCIHLLRGDTARQKLIGIEGLDLPRLHEKLCPKN